MIYIYIDIYRYIDIYIDICIYNNILYIYYIYIYIYIILEDTKTTSYYSFINSKAKKLIKMH